jgi:hypothetical protein
MRVAVAVLQQHVSVDDAGAACSWESGERGMCGGESSVAEGEPKLLTFHPAKDSRGEVFSTDGA